MDQIATASAPPPAEPDRPPVGEVHDAVRTLLRWVGEDPQREGLQDTPARVARTFREMFSGYEQDPQTFLGRVFEEVSGYDDMVLMRDVRFHSHCEHHMVPIHGVAHVAYLPEGRVVGLSKIARVVDIFAHRLQTQENMTAQIAHAIQTALEPRGVAVMLEADHMCMVMRGIRREGSRTLTTTFTGAFEDAAWQDRFLRLARG